MDLAIVAGIGLIGSFIVNKDNDPITESEKKHSSNNNKYEKYINQIESNENKNINTIDGYTNINNVRLFPTEYNSKTHHLYDNISAQQLNKKISTIAESQVEKSKNPVLTNIISPFYQPYENITKQELTMGTVPINELKLTNDSFNDQFKLQTVDNNKEPFSIGDKYNVSLNDFSPFDNTTIDMTYNIINREDFKQNNMLPMTAKRDVETNESNNFEYKMDIFSGSSKNWNPKKEAPHFFEPTENIQTPFGSGLTTEAERDRIIQSRIKQNQRPFEPIKTAPGVNLDYNEQPVTGFHDPFRIMPYDTDQLRPANKPKITFEDRIKGVPKKGEKRGITSTVIKRRPNHWKYQDFNDLVPSKAQTTKQSITGDYVLPDNARMRTCELVGPSQGPSLVGPSNREGKVKITKRVTHIEDKLGPKSTDTFNPNQKSYNILINDRNTANFTQIQPPKNTNKSGIKFDPNDIAKPTTRQDLTTKHFNNNAKQLISSYSNLTDEAKLTIKQILSTQTYQQIMSSLQHNTYTNLPDNAKQTLKEILITTQNNTHIGTAQHNTYTNLPDNAKHTLKEILNNTETNTHIGTSQHNTYTNLPDNAKHTLKEILNYIETNTHIGTSQHNPISSLSDSAKTTFKQILSSIQLNTNTNPAHKESITNIIDLAKTTIKEQLAIIETNTNINSNHKEAFTNLQDNMRTTTRQTLTNTEFNTFISRTMSNYTNLNDEAKHTIKQILAIQPLNTIIGTAQKNTYTNISDDVKQTIRQLLTLETFSNHIKQNIGSYSNITDNAKTTLKELLSLIENNTNIKTAQQSIYAELSDIAKTTIKEYISTQTFNNNMGTIKKEVAFDFNDMARTTHKQDLLNEKYMGTITNSKIGTTQTNFDIQPTMKDITKIIDYKSGASSAGFNHQPESQYDARNMRQNISKEIISKGQYPTLSGPKLIPVKEIHNNMYQKNKPNYDRSNAPSLTTKINLSDRVLFNLPNHNEKTLKFYDERLYNELLTQFNDNPLINNPQSTTNAKFVL